MYKYIAGWLATISAAAFIAALIGEGEAWINWITTIAGFLAGLWFTYKGGSDGN